MSRYPARHDFLTQSRKDHKESKSSLRGALGGLARVLQFVGSPPIQGLHHLLKALHPSFQVLHDLFSQDVWIREVVQVGQVFVSDPEDVQACFVAGYNFIIGELAPPAVGVVF